MKPYGIDGDGYAGAEPRSRALGSRRASAHGPSPFRGPAAPSLPSGRRWSVVAAVMFGLVLAAPLWIWLPYVALSMSCMAFVAFVLTTVIRRAWRWKP